MVNSVVSLLNSARSPSLTRRLDRACSLPSADCLNSALHTKSSLSRLFAVCCMPPPFSIIFFIFFLIISTIFRHFQHSPPHITPRWRPLSSPCSSPKYTSLIHPQSQPVGEFNCKLGAREASHEYRPMVNG